MTDLFSQPQDIEVILPDYIEAKGQEHSDRLKTLFNLLYLNRKRYYKADYLSSYLGITSRRLRLLVHDLREAGYAVISDSNGYKYATRAEEIDRCISRLFASISTMAVAGRGLIKARQHTFEGQVEIDLDEVNRLYEILKSEINEAP